MPPRAANWSPRTGPFWARRKKPCTPFARPPPCTGWFHVRGSVIRILGSPMLRTHVGAQHVVYGTGCFGMGVTAGGAPTVMVYFTVVGTTLLHHGTGTTAMGGTAPMHGEHGMVMPPCAFTRWRRMRRAHAEDGMCIAVLLCCCSRLFLRLQTLIDGTPAISPTLLLVYAGCGWNGCDRFGRPRLSPKELRHTRPPRRDGLWPILLGRPATQTEERGKGNYQSGLWILGRKGLH